MTSKNKMLSLLLAGTFLSSPAWSAQTVNNYDNLLQALETADADVVLDMNGSGIDLAGGTGLQVKDGQSVVFANIGTKGVSSWTETSKNITNTGTIAIKNTIFDTNHTELTSYAGGGVIFNQGGHITEISDSYFCNNTQNSVGTIWGGTVRNTNNGTIDLIKNVVFENNYAHAGNAAPHGGSILNGYSPTSTGYIKLIDGVKFINNSMTSDSDKTGGAHGVGIDNNEGGVIDKITNSQFINNKTYRTGEAEKPNSNYHSSAGALDNYNIIGEISDTLFKGNGAQVESVSASATSGAIMNIYGGTDMNGKIGKITNVQFIDNYVVNKNGSAYGGAIVNGSSVSGSEETGQIGLLENVLFKGNYAQSQNGFAHAGAIDNGGILGNITGDFVNNHVQSEARNSRGGAIDNSGKINGITGNFVGNHALGNEENSSIQNQGGAILNSGEITSIFGDFIGNYSKSANSIGGAILNTGTINSITGNFIDNHNTSTKFNARGGAVFNTGTIKLSGLFANNYAVSQYDYAQGGAIHNQGTMNIENASFIDNYAIGVAEKYARGGAIWTKTDLNISAKDGYNSIFNGNYVSTDNGITKKYQAVYIDNADLTLSSVNAGTISFDDGIDGVNYNIKVSGDGSGVVKFNNLVENVQNFTLSDKSVVHLGLNADIRAQNMSVSESGQIVSPNAASASPIITVDVEVDKASNTVSSGAVRVEQDVSGDYRVLVNALNPDVLDNKDDAIVPFLFAPNDDAATASSFSIARVMGSPYLWDGSVNAKGEESGSTWYLNLTDIVNPNYIPETPVIAPEVIAGAGLHEAAIEQTRSVVRNVRGKVAANRLYCPGCGNMDYNWNGTQNRNVWALVQGETASIDKPVKMDADIWGIEAGFDIQNDVSNTIGVFASYRKGKYDLNGKASKLRSNAGSEIDIDSYLAGLYYRYDKNMNWLFATVYGGVQKADAKTDDNVAKFDTDGIEFGGSVEAGHTFALSSDLTLEPSVGLYYTQINFDDAKDNVGKEYDWKDIRHLEAELGAKLEKQIDYAKIYVKPSVIQTITSGDSVKVTGLNKLSTYDDGTLGRIELGGRYGFTDALSVYGWVNYTFGSDYDATAFGAGLNYAW